MKTHDRLMRIKTELASPCIGDGPLFTAELVRWLVDEVERVRDDDRRIVHEPIQQAEAELTALKRRTCIWTQDEWTCAWDTTCKNSFILETGNPAQNQMRFCPYCGGRLKAGKAGQP